MKIYAKLQKVKAEIGKISKDSTNPFFKSKYFDVNALLEHVEPIIQKNDLILLQPIRNGNVITEIIDAESGENISSELALPQLNDAQKIGSAITYYRRYTLQSLLGLQAEDDDANLASKPSINLDRLNTRLNACKNSDELKNTYTSFTEVEKKATKVLATQLKQKLSA